MTSLQPLSGFALVKLESKYGPIGDIDTETTLKYNRSTQGICLSWSGDKDCYPSGKDLMGKRVFWEEYQASEKIERDGEEYAFIKLEDIRGCEDVDK